METKQPLFSPNAKGLIESNNHVDWSAFNILLPWKRQSKGKVDSHCEHLYQFANTSGGVWICQKCGDMKKG